MSRTDESITHTEMESDAPARANGWAWAICWLMFASTVLNYMDRQTIALVGPQIRADFAITQYVDFGWVLSAFIMTYALFQVPAGYLVDRWDLRWSYAAAVTGWSLAAVATGLVPNFWMLIVLRALLGVGESFNWPCALRVTARVLPPADRSLGNGIFNSGAAVGAVVTPIVVTFLVWAYSWRAAFIVVGSAGFVWVAAWLILVRGEARRLLAARKPDGVGDDRLDPERPPWSRPAGVAFGAVLVASIAVGVSSIKFGPSAIWLAIALAMLGPLAIAATMPLDHLRGVPMVASLAEVVRLRRFWIMIIVAVSINICWHFLINWIPTYLKDERGLDYRTSNLLSAIPFLAADAGNLGGGWLSRLLAARGFRAVRARQVVMVLCMVLILPGIGVGLARDKATALLLLSVMATGTAAFMANYFAFTQEVSSRHTGLVVGYLGGVANLFVAGFQPFAGIMKDRTGSFAPIFVIVGLAPLIGLAALLWGWDDSKGRAAREV